MMNRLLYCICSLCLLLFSHTPVHSQPLKLPLKELIELREPAWPRLQQWLATAKNQVVPISVDSIRGPEALFRTQVSTRAPMGALIYQTGGLLVDHGWIRVLGSGGPGLSRSLPGWNRGRTFKEYGDSTPYLLIADDAIGGFFALNGGGLGGDKGKVYYLSPDNLEWESLGISYTDFLLFCLNGDLNQFYANSRWVGWQQDMDNIQGDQVFSFTPPLWSLGGKKPEPGTRKLIPVEEAYRITTELSAKLKSRKNGR